MAGIQESSVFSAISSLFSSYGPAVLNGLIVVSTISGQSLIKRLTFSCPCANPLNVYQSVVFLFGPCLALFLFAILVNQNTWRLVHGCCFRTASARHPFYTAFLYWLQIIGQALIAPVAWLFVALLDGDYYSCLRAGQFCVGSKLCAAEQQRQVCDACVCAMDSASLSLLQSQSQVLAWALLVSVGLIALTTICTVRMCDRYTYVQNNYVKMYRETEKRVFEEMAKEMASHTALTNSRAFFGKPQLAKEDWDWLSSLPSLEDPFMFARHFRWGDRIRPRHWMQETEPEEGRDPHNNYTTLQRWNRKHGGRSELNGVVAAQPPA